MNSIQLTQSIFQNQNYYTFMQIVLFTNCITYFYIDFKLDNYFVHKMPINTFFIKLICVFKIINF